MTSVGNDLLTTSVNWAWARIFASRMRISRSISSFYDNRKPTATVDLDFGGFTWNLFAKT